MNPSNGKPHEEVPPPPKPVEPSPEDAAWWANEVDHTDWPSEEEDPLTTDEVDPWTMGDQYEADGDFDR